MSKRYEAVVVFEPNLGEAEVGQQIEKIEAIIKSHSGQLERQDVWGRRELSYKIKKKSHGIYAVLVFNGANTLVTDLRRQLRINDSVLRALIVDKDQYAPDMTRPMHGEGAPSFRDSRGDDADGESEEAAA